VQKAERRISASAFNFGFGFGFDRRSPHISQLAMKY
jgi:hypothetical protein